MHLGSEDELVELIYQVTQDEQHFVSQRLKQIGLNILQSRALNFIAAHPGAIQKELSRYLGKQDATTTNILKVLETRQLVTRRVQTDNERQKQLYLLPDGQELIATIRNIFIKLEGQVSTNLQPNEKAVMIELLQRIHSQFAEQS